MNTLNAIQPFFEHLPQASLLITAKNDVFVVTYANRMAQQLLAFTSLSPTPYEAFWAPYLEDPKQKNSSTLAATASHGLTQKVKIKLHPDFKATNPGYKHLNLTLTPYTTNEKLDYILVTMVFDLPKIKKTTAQKEWIKSQRLLDAAELAANFGTWEFDLIENKIYWSAGVFRLCGLKYSEAPISFENAMDIIHKDDHEKALQAMDNLLHHGIPYHIEKRLLHSNGTAINILSSGILFKDEKGNPLRIVGVFKDITKQKQTAARLQNTTNNIPGVVYRFTRKQNGESYFEHISQGAKNIWGFTPNGKEICLKDIRALYHPDDMPGLQAAVDDSMTHLTNWTYEWRMINPDKSVKWLRGSGIPQRLENGDTCWDAIIIDITAEKEIALALEERELVFRSLFDNVNNLAVQGYDKNEAVLFWNKASEQLYGYTYEEAIGKKLTDLIIPPNMQQKVSEGVQQMLASNEAIPGEELLLKHKDGHLVPVYSNHSVVNRPGKDAQLFCIDIDMRQLKATEEALEKSNANLQNIMDQSVDLICTMNEQGVFVDVSASVKNILGFAPEDIIHRPYTDYLHPIDLENTLMTGALVVQGFKTDYFENRYIHKNGSTVHLMWSANWNADTKLLYCVAKDITSLKRQQALEKLEKQLLESYTANPAAHADILSTYILGLEKLFPSMKISTLKIVNKKLKNFVSPSLPKTYLAAIENTPIAPDAGSCGTAAYLKKTIIVEDIAHDPLWEKYAAAALDAGLKACWSIPIISTTDQIMATLAIYYDEAKKPSREEQELIERISQLFQIILENQQKENDLISAQQRYRLVKQATFDATWDWNLATHEIHWGEGFQTIFGYLNPMMQASPQTWETLIHPDDVEATMASLQQLFDSQENIWHRTYRFKKADGTYAVVNNRGIVVRNAKGKVRRMVGAMQDITNKQKEERKLKLLQSAITNTLDGVLILSMASDQSQQKTKVEFMNPHFSVMLGYTLEDYERFGARKVMGPKTNIGTLQILKQEINKGEKSEADVLLYKKTGEPIWVNLSIAPVAAPPDKSKFWVCILKDITERKTAEIEKEMLNDVSQVFSKPYDLKKSIQKTLRILNEYQSFALAEVWLVQPHQNTIHLSGYYYTHKKYQAFYEQAPTKIFEKNKGLPGITWATKKLNTWRLDQYQDSFVRSAAAKKVGLQEVCGVPLWYGNQVIGVLLYAHTEPKTTLAKQHVFCNTVGKHLGAEIRRKQLEDELGQIFMFSPDIICISGMDGFYKKVNPAMTQLLGYDEKTLLKHPITHFVHPEDQAATQQVINNLHHDTATSYSENRYITKSGKIVWLGWTANVIEETNLIYAIAKDITEKKELEMLLQEANALARLGTWEVNLASGEIYVSEMTEAITGFENAVFENLEEAIPLMYPKEHQVEVQKLITNTLTTGEPWDIEIEIQTKNEGKKWVRLIGQADFVDGHCQRLFGSIQDIHERKNRDIALLASYKEKTDILERITEGFFALDNQWQFTYFNNKAEDYLGVNRSDVLGKNIWEAFKTSKDLLHVDKYIEAFEKQVSIHIEDFFPAIGKWFDINGYPTPNGMSVFFKDISDRKQAELNLQKLNRELQHQTQELAYTNAELEQFAYIASHDLQEPLRMVTSFLVQIEKKYNNILDDRGKQYIHFAVDGARRMRGIILDLLEFSRVGKEDTELETIDLNVMLEEIQFLLKTRIAEVKASFKVHDLPTVVCWKAPLRQVWQNLIDNALKYHDKSRPLHIEISVTTQDDHWAFAIRDTGQGIESEYYDKIFMIFQRLHRKESYSGTGMGLAITKKIVENMGGNIWVSSTPNQGSTFFFTLPKTQL